jgi:hypothetical protein
LNAGVSFITLGDLHFSSCWTGELSSFETELDLDEEGTEGEDEDEFDGEAGSFLFSEGELDLELLLFESLDDELSFLFNILSMLNELFFSVLGDGKLDFLISLSIFVVNLNFLFFSK